MMNRYACPCCQVDKVAERAKKAIEAIETILDIKFTITSAYRCPKHNAEVNGAPASRHCLHGDAFDIAWPNDDTRKKIIEIAMACGFRGVGLGRTFIHIDMRPNRVTWSYK